MQIITIDSYPGRDYEVLGLVVGSSTRASNAAKDWFSGFRDFFGGRSQAYREVLENSIKDIYQDLAEKGRAGGADAIIGFRVTSSSVGGSKMLAFQGYGTAIRFKS